MSTERDLGSTALRTSLINGDPFVYAHLIKFERAVTTASSKPARNARDYTYISDASVDIVWDDGSKNVKGVSNGAQTYRADRVKKVGTISETIEAKATNMSIAIASEGLSSRSPETALITINYTAANTVGSGVTLTIAGTLPGWKESGFLEGDKITIKKSNAPNFHNKRAVITSFSSDDKTITCEALDGGGSASSTTGDFVVFNSADQYESVFYEEFESTGENGAYAGYINREVFVYKTHINPTTGDMIGSPYLIFKGIIAKAKVTEDVNKSSQVVWSMTSHWGDFVRVNGRLTSDSQHRALSSDGRVDQDALIRYEYGSDLGFMHAEKSINIIAEYQRAETRYKMKSSGFIFKKYKMVEYTEMVDADVDLRFNLEAKYLPVIYGVQRTDSIPIFADTLYSDASEIYVVYAICEGEIGGIYDMYIDDVSRICLSENDFDTRSTQNDDKTIDVICEGRMDRGDTLSSLPAFTTDNSYYRYMGQMTSFRFGIPNLANLDYILRVRGLNRNSKSSINQASGVTHEKRTSITYPINGDFNFHSGRAHQRADDMLVRIADKGLKNDDNTLNQGFKLQAGSENEDLYWTPNHRLLDTAYIAAKYKVSEGDITIPSIDFVVRGKEVEQYNYDWSYEQKSNPVYAGGNTSASQEASFKIGDKVDVYYNNSGTDTALAQDVTIMAKPVYTNAREEPITKFRFNKDPLINASNVRIGTTEFWIVKDGQLSSANDKLLLSTWDAQSESGTIPSIVSAQFNGDFTSSDANKLIVAANSGGPGVDITVPDGDLKNILTHTATEESMLVSVLEAGETPGTVDIEKTCTYIQPGDYNTTTNKLTNIGNTQIVDNLPDTNDILVVANAVKLANNTGSSVNNYYKGQRIEVTRTFDDGTTKSFNSQIISYLGAHKIVLFGDLTPSVAAAQTQIYPYVQANITGSVGDAYMTVLMPADASGTPGEGTKIYFNINTASENTLDAIQALLAGDSSQSPPVPAKSVYPVDRNFNEEVHKIEDGTSIVSVINTNIERSITYSKSVKFNLTAQVYHTYNPTGTDASTLEVFEPGTGEFIPNTGDTYRIISKGDKKVSINPAMQLLDYLTNTRFGRGLDLEEDIDLESFKEAARDCDTRSKIHVFANSTTNMAAGDIYQYKPSLTGGGSTLFWQGTVESVTQRTQTNNDVSYEIVFKDCIGKLISRWEKWKTHGHTKSINEGQLFWKQHSTTVSNETTFKSKVHKIPNGIEDLASVVSDTHVQANVDLTKLSGAGPSTITLGCPTSGLGLNQVSANGNPIVKAWDSKVSYPNNHGYTIYDSDDVKYWRYVGWQSHSQDEVTRHQCNAALRASDPVFQNVNTLLNHFNGILRYSAGKYVLAVEQAVNNAGYVTDDPRIITEDEIIGAISVDDAGIKGAANSVSVSIPDPSIRYDNRSVTFFNSEYLKQDRGVPKKKDLKSPLISNYFNARINAEQYLIQSRSNKKINFKIGPQGILLVAGELIKVTYPRFGYDNKVFRITNLSYTADCLTQVTATEHDDNTYIIGSKVNDNIQDGEGGGTTGEDTPNAPQALTAVGGRLKVELTVFPAVEAGPAWETVIYRSTSNSMSSLTDANIIKTWKGKLLALTHEDTFVEIETNTVYYYWARHVKEVKKANGLTAHYRSLFFPNGNGISATVNPSVVENQETVWLYRSDLAQDLTAFNAGHGDPNTLLPPQISGFPTITYTFSGGITGVSSGSISGDQIGSTGWYRTMPAQVGTAAIWGVSALARGPSATDDILRNEWVLQPNPVAPGNTDSKGIVATASNLTYMFDMVDGTANNDWNSSFRVVSDDTLWTYGTTSGAANTFNITFSAYTGGVASGDVTIVSSGTDLGNLLLSNSAGIIATEAVNRGGFTVTLRDNVDGHDFAEFVYTFTKMQLNQRSGQHYKFDSTNGGTSTIAAAWKGTLTDAIARDVANLVIASPLTAKDGHAGDGSTTLVKRIVPNDRITVSNGSTIATRIYQDVARKSSQVSQINVADFSSVVTNEFDGSVIVDGTLAADAIVSQDTFSNILHVGSALKVGSQVNIDDVNSSLQDAKIHSFQKTALSSTTAGFYMDGAGNFALGKSNGAQLTFSNNTLALTGAAITLDDGNALNAAYIASKGPVVSVNGSTGDVTVTVPTHTNQLTNNSAFQTLTDLNTKLGDYLTTASAAGTYLTTSTAGQKFLDVSSNTSSETALLNNLKAILTNEGIAFENTLTQKVWEANGGSGNVAEASGSWSDATVAKFNSALTAGGLAVSASTPFLSANTIVAAGVVQLKSATNNANGYNYISMDAINNQIIVAEQNSNNSGSTIRVKIGKLS